MPESELPAILPFAIPAEPDEEGDRAVLLATRSELQARAEEASRLRGQVRELQQRLAEATEEIEETNRGMLALYAELDEQAEQIRRSSELKSRFLRYITHELRTPLGSTIRLCQLLLDRIDGELTPEQERQVVMIRRSSETLADLVNDLLDLARIEAGKTEVRPRTVRISELFAGLRGMLRPLVPSEAVTLNFVDTSHLPTLYTDEGKLSQILRNFISNALKCTSRGEVRVEARLSGAGMITFSVVDTGVGIAPEDQERIFDEFAQVHTPGQPQTRGSGLGLPLSRNLAELLGGTVSLRSVLGRGSEFSVTLPIQFTGEAADSHPHGAGSGSQSRRTPTILIVDDEETSRYLLAKLLARSRADIVEAESGVKGLEAARALQPDLIFLDLVMPELDGFEVIRELQDDPLTRAIPVVVVTGKPLSSPEARYLDERHVSLFSKMLPPAELAAAVHASLLRYGISVDASTEEAGNDR